MRIHQREVTVAEAHPSKFNVENCGERHVGVGDGGGRAVSPEWIFLQGIGGLWIG
jgi:hypothetical protein